MYSAFVISFSAPKSIKGASFFGLRASLDLCDANAIVSPGHSVQGLNFRVCIIAGPVTCEGIIHDDRGGNHKRRRHLLLCRRVLEGERCNGDRNLTDCGDCLAYGARRHRRSSSRTASSRSLRLLNVVARVRSRGGACDRAVVLRPPLPPSAEPLLRSVPLTSREYIVDE